MTPQHQIPPPLPLGLDVPAIVADLRELGWNVYKTEQVCGLSVGYVGNALTRPDPALILRHAARLHNFWRDELLRHYERIHTQVSST